MTNTDIVNQRLHNEHLIGDRFEKVDDVVKWFGGVQSQDYPGAKWAVAQRVKGLVTNEEIDALFNAGKILRTHVMRPTWHFVHPSDIRWVLELTKDRVKMLMGHYNRKLELDDTLFKKTAKIFTKVLANKNYVTRQELKVHLTNAGIKTDVQRLAHIVMWAELDGLICSGPLKGKQFTYALLEERVPTFKKLSREEALAEITKRYFTSHGPALAQDCSWWSGLTVADIQKGIAMNKNTLESVEINEKKYWLARSTKQIKKVSSLQLLPNYDEYLISYKDYSPVQDPAFHKQYADNMMFYRHIIVSNGIVIGGWKREAEKDAAVITIQSIRQLTKEESSLLKKEIERLSKFLKMPVRVTD